MERLYMEFVSEWKSMWPVSSTFSAPLLIQNKSPKTPFGPLIFTAKPDSSTTLFHSPSLSPHLPPPYPQLPISRFMQNYSIVPSAATSISSLLGHQLPDYSSYFHGFNSLQLLQIPTKNLIVAFFPTGEKSDHVGFSLLSVKGGGLNVLSRSKDLFEVVKEGNVDHQRITRLLVNPVDDFCGDDISKPNNVVTVGFLMVCTNYSVYWYKVGITTVGRRVGQYSVCLDYLGCANAKMLRGSAVVSACWSPHLNEECCVLLENGDLMLFDVNYCYGQKNNSMSPFSGSSNIFKKIMQVSLTDELGLEKEEDGNEGLHWFECEYSWHPRIFVASHRDEVFLVDLRYSGVCNITCLLKLETLSMGKDDGFLALSRAGSDGFTFTVATKSLLFLFDVRKPLLPILRWSHGIQNPMYMTVFRLSDLRANAEDSKYKLASESGYCVMLGSFWDDKFNLFCYGPDFVYKNESLSSEISKFCNIYYAWGFPSVLSLSSSDCKCGSCLVREEFLQASLPVWIDWRQKRHLTLGFGILKPSLSAKFSRDSFGGFVLIRLTSSGKLETQQYFAASESKNIQESSHNRKKCYSEDNLLFDCNSSEHDLVKKYKYLKLENLSAYLEGKLAKRIAERRGKGEDNDENALKTSNSESKFHEEICHRLKALGFPKEQSSCAAVSAVLEDISLPTSIHEIALGSMCAALPINLLRLAFSTYTDFCDEDFQNHEEEPLEFLDIPKQLQVPPFPLRKPSDRSNRWSAKVKRPDAIVGPILSPLFLTTLHKLCLEELKEERELYLEETEAFSPQGQLKDQCDKVVQVVKEQYSGANADDDFVCLGDDVTQDMSTVSEKPKLSCHKPSHFLQKPGTDYMFSTHVFRRRQELESDISAETEGTQELFDVGCPVELKFDDDEVSIEFGAKELEILRGLKKKDLNFQRRVKPYQDYIHGKDELKLE